MHRYYSRPVQSISTCTESVNHPQLIDSRLLYSPSEDEELYEELDEDEDERRENEDSDESTSERDHQVLGFLADFLGHEVRVHVAVIVIIALSAMDECRIVKRK